MGRMENDGKRRKRGFVAAMLQLLKGAGLGCFWAWLAVSFFVRRTIGEGPDRYSEELGLFHIPTARDAWALSIGCILGLIYAAAQLKKGEGL